MALNVTSLTRSLVRVHLSLIHILSIYTMCHCFFTCDVCSHLGMKLSEETAANLFA